MRLTAADRHTCSYLCRLSRHVSATDLWGDLADGPPVGAVLAGKRILAREPLGPLTEIGAPHAPGARHRAWLVWWREEDAE